MKKVLGTIAAILLFFSFSSFASAEFFHKVRQGQTLWTIALAYGMTVRELKKINGLASNLIRVGNWLEVKPKKYFAVASWYGPKFHGRPMANREIFDMHSLVVAHKVLPLGSVVKITNTKTGRHVVLSVKDRGPYIKGRHFDLSLAAAKKLGMEKQGVEKLRIKIIYLPPKN